MGDQWARQWRVTQQWRASRRHRPRRTGRRAALHRTGTAGRWARPRSTWPRWRRRPGRRSRDRRRHRSRLRRFGGQPGRWASAGSRLPDPLGDRRAGVQCHLVDRLDLAFEPYGPGHRVIDVDHLREQLGGVLVAGLGGQRDRPAELGRGGLHVAGLAGGQPLLDRGRQLGLPGVVRDLRVDPGGQRAVIRPGGDDLRFPQDLAVRQDQADPAGQHPVADPAD